jgi:hypothetical protein
MSPFMLIGMVAFVVSSGLLTGWYLAAEKLNTLFYGKKEDL